MKALPRGASSRKSLSRRVKREALRFAIEFCCLAASALITSSALSPFNVAFPKRSGKVLEARELSNAWPRAPQVQRSFFENEPRFVAFRPQNRSEISRRQSGVRADACLMGPICRMRVIQSRPPPPMPLELRSVRLNRPWAPPEKTIGERTAAVA
eukprot:CAMPEP_0206548430 /NCGR_PEP_ID=MMETSP0325_2-20121206/13878_1 /ASSEMBLY_ACC=CAM_ASM_000347 /TAXON_ID=2866 /ORGANISM="Crypthecodinium cohnii, Strain Seligo" /LENGTH=154 /DNA_ID=CAMNT_0054047907 /DNA_START=1206 /DNA_END=1667 /DNA_ORIENTATION=-